MNCLKRTKKQSTSTAVASLAIWGCTLTAEWLTETIYPPASVTEAPLHEHCTCCAPQCFCCAPMHSLYFHCICCVPTASTMLPLHLPCSLCIYCVLCLCVLPALWPFLMCLSVLPLMPTLLLFISYSKIHSKATPSRLFLIRRSHWLLTHDF